MIFSKAIKSLDQFSFFIDRLTPLLQHGMDIRHALGVLIQDEKNEAFKAKLKRFKSALESGGDVIQCLQELSPSAFHLNLSQTMTVPDTHLFLKKLGQFSAYKSTQLNGVQKKMTYPLFLLVLSGLFLMLFIFVLLPAYQGLMSSMLNETPPLIKGVMLGAQFIREHGVFMLFLGCLGLLVLTNRWGKSVMQALMDWLFKSKSIDFLWLLSLLLKSGISIKAALEMLIPYSEQSKGSPFLYARNNFFKNGEFAHSFATALALNSFQRECLLSGEKGAVLSEAIDVAIQDLDKMAVAKMARKLFWLQPLLLSLIGLIMFCFLYLTFIPILTTINH